MPAGELLDVLAEAQQRGLIGPGPIEAQVRHALALGHVAGGWAAAGGQPSRSGPQPALDLGSGGGLPGLVLAVSWLDSRWLLLDSRSRSAGFLREAIEVLGLGDRVTVLEARAEVAGRDAAHRAGFALVTARGFAAPAVTAECAAPFLAVGGRLVVSEPPGSAGERWPAEPLRRLGLVLEAVERRGAATFAVLTQVERCPPEFPRRSGVPSKRPLFPNPVVEVSRETNPVLDPQARQVQDRLQ